VEIPFQGVRDCRYKVPEWLIYVSQAGSSPHESSNDILQMRWSQVVVCLLTVLFGVAFHEVLGHSNDHLSSIGGHGPTIERRAPGRTRLQTPSKKSGPKAASFRSSNYRDVAMKSGGNYDPFTNTVKKSKITKTQAKGKDAGMSLFAPQGGKIHRLGDRPRIRGAVLTQDAGKEQSHVSYAVHCDCLVRFTMAQAYEQAASTTQENIQFS
jgi:hypothetical protein